MLPYKICIVCEGDEETQYLKKLQQLGIFQKDYYDEISIICAGGIRNVDKKYDACYKKDKYDVVFAFCDTEKHPYTQFNHVKEELCKIYGKKTSVDKILFYANPSTMLIILSHFSKVKLESNSKKVNRPIIEQLTGVKDYDAHVDQINEIMRLINKQNYKVLKNNLSKLGTDEKVLGSTNFLKLLEYLESNDSQWIVDIMKELGN